MESPGLQPSSCYVSVVKHEDQDDNSRNIAQQHQYEALCAAASTDGISIQNQHPIALTTDQDLLNMQHPEHQQPASRAETESFHKYRNSTPERTTPVNHQEQKHDDGFVGTACEPGKKILAAESLNYDTASAAKPAERSTRDAGFNVHICCHDQSKQNAVLTQQLEYLGQQIEHEKSQAKMKEQQYQKMIDALKNTPEDNNKKFLSVPINLGPTQKEWKEIFDELNTKKQEINDLQDGLLEQELKADKAALDFKTQLQQKDDEISEEHLKNKHKDSNLRVAQQKIERLNEDIQNRINEALDKQSDRLAKEKQSDLDALNRRNEQLIVQLVASHTEETRQLRAILLEQEHKCRSAEQQLTSQDIEIRSLKMENETQFNATDLEELQEYNKKVNKMRLETLNQKNQEEKQQLSDIISQIEQQIGQLQEEKGEFQRKQIITKNKIDEINKENARQSILINALKEKEQKIQQNFNVQIQKERRAADNTIKKMKNVQKLEEELNKKQITINELRSKIIWMEREEMHAQKILLMKRRQIEDEKTVLIKKQALRQRIMTKSNLSATRLKQKLETSQAVIHMERQSKIALQQEKAKLENTIVSLKRENNSRMSNRGDESSRHNDNESISMYFARSQGIFSPPTKVKERMSIKSFVAKGSKMSRPQVSSSQQTFDPHQLYLSKQKSSSGTRSFREGDSMVNIVEFEDNIMPRRWNGKSTIDGVEVSGAGSMLTPYKKTEKIEKTAKFSNSNKAKMSQSALETRHGFINKSFKKIVFGSTNQHDINDSSPAAALPTGQTSSSQQASTDILNEKQQNFQGRIDFMAIPQRESPSNENHIQENFRTIEGKKVELIERGTSNTNREEEEKLIQVLAGCNSSNDESCEEIINLPPQKERKHPERISTKNQSRQNHTNNFGHQNTKSLKDLTTQLMLAKLPNKLLEQNFMNQKEQFVRSVRQKCEDFNTVIRQKEEALTTRNVPNNSIERQPDTSTFNQANKELEEGQKTAEIETNNLQQSKSSQPSFSLNQQETNSAQALLQRVQHHRADTLPAEVIINEDEGCFKAPPYSERYQSLNYDELGLISNRVSDEVRGKLLVESETGQCKESGLEVDNNNYNAFNNTIASLAAKLNIDSRTAEGHLKNNTDALTRFSTKSFFMNDNAGESYLQGVISQIQGEKTDRSRKYKPKNFVCPLQLKSFGSISEAPSIKHPLSEENAILKEQLELVKQTLAEQKKRTETSELTMMDAIMQMKEQISQVITNTTSGESNKNPLPTIMNSAEQQVSHTTGQVIAPKPTINLMKSIKKNVKDDYMAMSRVSRKLFESDNDYNIEKFKEKRLNGHQFVTSNLYETPFNRKNSQTQSSKTFDVTRSQTESMYKKITTRSPKKRHAQAGRFSGMTIGGLTPIALNKNQLFSDTNRRQTMHTHSMSEHLATQQNLN